MANAANFTARRNARQAIVSVRTREHTKIETLKGLTRDDIGEQIFNYLSKCIPYYPNPVEFHITEVAHVTNKTSLPLIWKSEGFKGLDENSFSWWSLKINEADIRAAEERFLESKIPNRTKEERAAQQPFLSEFTTSPAFKNEISRYGNFRFTFPLTELMEAYKEQMCEGEEPVLRVYKTKLFKQEIEYVVLVHSPQNEEFSQYPLLPSNQSTSNQSTSNQPTSNQSTSNQPTSNQPTSNQSTSNQPTSNQPTSNQPTSNQSTSKPVNSIDGNQIIWRAQAVCETHNYQLEIIGNTAVTQPMCSHEFYVWDQVSLVFHVNGVLTFPKEKLKASLSCCKLDPNINLSHGENCSSLKEAEKFTESLPDDEFIKEEHTSGEIQMEVD